MSWTDLFIKVDKTADTAVKEDKTPLTPINPVQSNPVNVQQSFTTNATQASVNVGLDQTLLAKLQEIFEKANVAGPDLYEFIMSVKKLEGKPLDERTKFEMVYDAQSSVGLTKEKLISSGQFYVNTFNDVKQEFDKEFQTKVQHEVTLLNQQADAVIQENAAMQQQIAELNQKISDNLTRMQTLRSEATNNENRLVQQKMSFENTHTTFVSNVQKFIDGVTAYIK